MSFNRLKRTLAAAAGLALAGGLCAQEPASPPRSVQFPLLPETSPKCSLKQRVGLTDIEVVYSRPNVGRHQVFGGIVPYDVLWRTGDNASTKINFSTVVKLGGVEIPPGKYALYTIPGEKEWIVIINKDAGLWGVDGYNSGKDVARLNAIPQKLTDAVKSFTIDFDDIRDDSAVLNLTWATTRVSLKLEADVVPDLMVKVAASMDSPGKKSPAIYLQAARFYFNHTTDASHLGLALFWVDQALAVNPPNAYEFLHLKAQLLSRQGNRDGAREAALQSTSLAVAAEGPGTPYVKMNSEIMSGQRQ